MAQMPLDEHHIRKLQKVGRGGASLSVTIPVRIVRKLKLRERQKVAVRARGNKIIIEDWQP